MIWLARFQWRFDLCSPLPAINTRPQSDELRLHKISSGIEIVWGSGSEPDRFGIELERSLCRHLLAVELV